MSAKPKRAIRQDLSDSSPTGEQGDAAVHWNLDDLKCIASSRADRRAETLLTRVRHLAKNFSDSKAASTNVSFEDELQIRKSLFQINQSAKIVRVEKHIIVCRMPRVYGLPRIPAPYGLKGGSARLALLSLLGIDIRSLRPRDIDVVRFGGAGDALQRGKDEKLGAQFMPDDYSHGHGVEVCPSIESYLSTRDLTINEVVLLGGQLICTQSALSDTYEAILRPTKHAIAAETFNNGRMFLKVLRLYAESTVRGEPTSLEGFPAFTGASIHTVAMQLKRAEAIDRAVAIRFLELAASHGALDSLCMRHDQVEGDQLFELVSERLSQLSNHPSSDSRKTAVKRHPRLR